jgi:hypothetical protein
MAESRLLVEVEGAIHELGDCDWVLWAPCGCPVGTLAGYAASDAEAAMKEFYPLKRDRDRRKNLGYHMELMTHGRWKSEISERMRVACPHGKPKRRSTQLPGHGLLKEGAPFKQVDGRWETTYRPRGQGRCSCGEASKELDSDGARKRWHREHKDEIRKKIQEEKDAANV